MFEVEIPSPVEVYPIVTRASPASVWLESCERIYKVFPKTARRIPKNRKYTLVLKNFVARGGIIFKKDTISTRVIQIGKRIIKTRSVGD